MKKILLILLIIPLLGNTQNSNSYKEFNTGVYVNGFEFEGWSYIRTGIIFPGASFLWGKTIYYNNNTFLDYQAGVAFPTLITGKVGFGFGNENTPISLSLGVRPWPSSIYMQLHFPKNIILSVEPFPFADTQTTGIVTIGFRF